MKLLRWTGEVLLPFAALFRDAVEPAIERPPRRGRSLPSRANGQITGADRELPSEYLSLSKYLITDMNYGAEHLKLDRLGSACTRQ